MSEEKTVLVGEAELKRFCVAVLEKVGVPADQAGVIIDNLVEADLRGVDSHGVVRLPIYAKRLAAKAIDPRPVVKIVRETRTSAVYPDGVHTKRERGSDVGLKAVADHPG